MQGGFTVMETIYSPTEAEVLKQSKKAETQHHLIVWNDEVNTFDWVIKALMEICHHSKEQAEQCTLIIHYKGKYAVKSGTFESLRPMCEALIDWDINATID